MWNHWLLWKYLKPRYLIYSCSNQYRYLVLDELVWKMHREIYSCQGITSLSILLEHSEYSKQQRNRRNIIAAQPIHTYTSSIISQHISYSNMTLQIWTLSLWILRILWFVVTTILKQRTTFSWIFTLAQLSVQFVSLSVCNRYLDMAQAFIFRLKTRLCYLESVSLKTVFAAGTSFHPRILLFFKLNNPNYQ